MNDWQGVLRRCAAAGLACWAATGQAQVYKWTDANGKVHYGDKKDAAAARPQELKIKLPAAAPPAPMPPPAAWTPAAARWPEPAASAPPQQEQPRSASGGKEHGTDASRCALARDVLNGSLRHANGAPIDKYDIDVAQADVKRFCR